MTSVTAPPARVLATLASADRPPVTPDAPTARRWAVDELSRPEYQQHESVLSRVLRWLAGLFDGDLHGPDARTAALVVVGVLVVVAAVALVVTGPVRRTARARASQVVLADDLRTAAALRAAADAAEARGDWGLAVVERFRALVRGLEERAVLDERSGRTADEAARAAAAAFPPEAGALGPVALLFDDVLYGDARVGPEAAALVRAVDERVRAARPARVSTSALPGPVAP